MDQTASSHRLRNIEIENLKSTHGKFTVQSLLVYFFIVEPTFEEQRSRKPPSKKEHITGHPTLDFPHLFGFPSRSHQARISPKKRHLLKLGFSVSTQLPPGDKVSARQSTEAISVGIPAVSWDLRIERDSQWPGNDQAPPSL